MFSSQQDFYSIAILIISLDPFNPRTLEPKNLKSFRFTHLFVIITINESQRNLCKDHSDQDSHFWF